MTHGFSHYELLGLSPCADLRSIEARIRALRIQRAGPFAGRFVLWLRGVDVAALDRASADLLDAGQRRAYDAQLHRTRHWPPPFGPTL